MIRGLIRSGAARAWGTLNWTPEQMERAWQIADREGVPAPVSTQPPYSLVRREIVDDPDNCWQRPAMWQSWRRTRSRAASSPGNTTKILALAASGMLENPPVAPAVAAGRDLADLAKDIGKDPANLAMAFALLTPSVTIVLFGATRPGQVVANLGALAVADALTPDEHRRLAVTGQKNRG